MGNEHRKTRLLPTEKKRMYKNKKRRRQGSPKGDTRRTPVRAFRFGRTVCLYHCTCLSLLAPPYSQHFASLPFLLVKTTRHALTWRATVLKDLGFVFAERQEESIPAFSPTPLSPLSPMTAAAVIGVPRRKKRERGGTKERRRETRSGGDRRAPLSLSEAVDAQL